MPDRSMVMNQTKKEYPGPPGWGFGVGLTTPPSKKLIVTKVEQRKKLDGFNDDGWKRTERMERVGDRKKMEGYCSTGLKPTAGCSANGRRRSRRRRRRRKRRIAAI
jgi:hypothetical protein